MLCKNHARGGAGCMQESCQESYNFVRFRVGMGRAKWFGEEGRVVCKNRAKRR